jgi:hypothetical protein
MTRRPKKATRKPARKAAKPVRQAKKLIRKLTRRPARTPAKPSQPGSLDEFIAAAARELGLKIDKAWLPTVRSNLEVTLRHGALVASFPLPDEIDPAPVFEA